jgi:hypothetical protein
LFIAAENLDGNSYLILKCTGDEHIFIGVRGGDKISESSAFEAE